MKRFLYTTSAFLVLLGLLGVAGAQVNVVPQVGVASGIIKKASYSAVSIGLAPASSATDIFCISGSTTKTISVKQITVSGSAGTLITTPIVLLHRVSLDTGGTLATGTALPVAATHNSTNGAATAVLAAYTANPTIVDTSPTYLRAVTTSFNTTSALVSSPPINLLFGELVGEFVQALDIPEGVTGQYCLNLNSVSVSSGLLTIDTTWTEN